MQLAAEKPAAGGRSPRFFRRRAPGLEVPVAIGLLAFFGFIFILPVVQTFWYSLTAYDVLTGSARFLGSRNYERVVADPRFWNGLRVGLIYTLGTLGAGLTLQIFLAGLLTTFRGLPRAVLVMAYFLPAVLPNLVVVIIWRNMFRVDYGLLDTLALAFGVRPIPWLSDANWAMVSLVLLTVWKYLGYGGVIFLAGLNEIPASLYEAASIDGAGGLRQFFAISLPLLRPLILLQTVASVITLLQFFDPFYALTTGGPSGATQTLILYIYQESFQRLNFSYAAAMTTGLFLVLLVASAAQLWLGRRHLIAEGRE